MRTGRVVLLSALTLAVSTPSAAQPAGAIHLNTGWTLQSSAVIPTAGDRLSLTGIDTSGWHRVTVPGTIVGSLVAGRTTTFRHAGGAPRGHNRSRTMAVDTAPIPAPRLRRTLGLWDLVFYGIVLVQPVAPMGIFGVVSQEARGHVVTTILIGMVAMLLTAISYGRMARAYPSAGSAFTYVGQELHPALGYVTGWSMVMDYVLNPMICTIYCSKVAMTFLPAVPYTAWVAFFAMLFTVLNLRGIKSSARTSQMLAAGMFVVVVLFLGAAIRYIAAADPGRPELLRPFYDPATFSLPAVLTGASVACLTYIGFDGISTLSEEVENPRRNILLATVLTCLITGVLASLARVFGSARVG